MNKHNVCSLRVSRPDHEFPSLAIVLKTDQHSKYNMIIMTAPSEFKKDLGSSYCTEDTISNQLLHEYTTMVA